MLVVCFSFPACSECASVRTAIFPVCDRDRQQAPMFVVMMVGSWVPCCLRPADRRVLVENRPSPSNLSGRSLWATDVEVRRA